MPKPQLRARSGCLRCKLRKKKCDETKPVCMNCQRLELTCTWGTTAAAAVEEPGSRLLKSVQTQAVESESSVAIRRVPLARNLSKVTQIFKDQTQFDLTLLWPKILESQVHPYDIPAQSEKNATVMRIAFQEAVVCNALSATSAWFMYASTKRDTFLQACGDSYQRGLIALRQALASQVQQSFKLLVIHFGAAILGMLEVSVFGDHVNATRHFDAAAQTFLPALRCHQTNFNVLHILRLANECWTYHFGSIAIFLRRSELDKILSRVDWSAFYRLFGDTFERRFDILESTAHSGLHPAVMRLMLQITQAGRASRKNSPLSSETASAFTESELSWARELEVIEIADSRYFRDASPFKSKVGLTFNNLHLYAIRILARKVSHPRTCSSDPIISQVVAVAHKAMQQDFVQRYLATFVSWPIIVILCAVREKATFDSLSIGSESFTFSPGVQKIWPRILKALRGARVTEPCSNPKECNGGHDGLDLLLLEDGILSSSEDLVKTFNTMVNIDED